MSYAAVLKLMKPRPWYTLPVYGSTMSCRSLIRSILPVDGLIMSCRSLIRSMKADTLRDQPEWLQELEAMEETQVKAEIEAAYGAQGFGAFARYLGACLLQQQWLG